MQTAIGRSGFDIVTDGDHGHRPDWTNIYTFEQRLETEVVDEALRTISKCAYVTQPENTESWLYFRTRGFMDEAMAESVQKIQPILHQFIMPSIAKVELFSVEDASNNTGDNSIRIYNVTSTILNMLAQTNN